MVVNDYIFRISRLVEAKRARANDIKLTEEYGLDNHATDSIDQLIQNYAATKFSRDEELYFASLKENIVELKSQERALAQCNYSSREQSTS